PVRPKVGMELQEGRFIFIARNPIATETHIVDDEHAYRRLEHSQTLTRRPEANGREVTDEQEDIVDGPVGQVGQTQWSVDSESMAVELASLSRAFLMRRHRNSLPAKIPRTRGG
ncbi:hypothetical protein THAOC_19372, partial [Thalassiosira oceanica]